MKIALIHHQLSRGGGMETYFVDLIHECARLGHEVHVFTARVSNDFKLPKGVKLHIFPNRIFPKFLRKFYFAWEIKRYFKSQDYDLKISTTRSFSQDISIVGGTHRAFLKAFRRFRFFDPIETFFENKAYQASKILIAQSTGMKQELIDLYGIAPEKIRVLPPPVDSKQFSYRPHAPHQAFRILFVSSSHRRKGGYLLLEALKTLPADFCELWIAGRPFKETKTLLQSVNFLAYVKDLNPLYHETDLLVLPSFFEPFGLVVAQALECGTPVVVSKHAGIQDLISTNEGLILQEQSPKALADLLVAAKNTKFHIEPGFVKRHHLDLSEHVAQLLQPLRDHSHDKANN